MPASRTHTASYRRTDITRYTVSGSSRVISPYSTVGDLLTYVDHESRSNVWSKRFHDSHLYKCVNKSPQTVKPFGNVQELLKYLDDVLVLGGNSNISTVLSIEPKDANIDIVFQTPKFTLHDVLTYSPAVLQNSFCKVQFIIYQLLQCQYYLHSNGATLGSITLKDVYIDDNLWIKVCPKFSNEFTSRRWGLDEAVLVADLSADVSLPAPSPDRSDTATMTEKWVNGEITNLDYLMYINQCCGRVFGNPNHHPVLPWIMDFTQPLGGWRDLSKSKFRLNKGDDQLDQTYEVAQRVLQEGYDSRDEYECPQTVFPHHISDVLSDITYFTYKARRTAKETLCQHVRQKWVPHEYPSSIKRLQEWTPDECIPEFYTDPEIFLSIHNDLPDLEIPTWADSAEDFIEQHRAALESDYVSLHLHRWIDLTFGVKLSGQASIDAKNVCLELVDGHTTYTDHGIVQLFTKPHPERICVPTKYISSRAPDILYKQRAPQQRFSSLVSPAGDTQEPLTDSTEFDNMVKAMESLSTERILLPPDFDPLQLLNRIEKNPSVLPTLTSCSCDECPYHKDTVYLGCLLAKIILPVQTRLLGESTSVGLDQYVKQITNVIQRNRQDIPRALYCILETVLDIEDHDDINNQYNQGLPPVIPGLLLAPSVLPFPPYFSSLYELISDHLLINHLSIMPSSDEELKDKEELERRLKERLALYSQFLSEHGISLQAEGLELYLPYIKQLLVDGSGAQCVQAAWCLFCPLSQILGVDRSRTHLSPFILDLYSREDISDEKKVKLFHRAFLQQIIMQLGVTHFIDHYSQVLVTAVCGTRTCLTDTAQFTQATSADQGLDLASILTESIVWLAGRLGPLLTAKYFTSKILQSMKDCYGMHSAFTELPDKTDDLTSITTAGDTLLLPAIRCLEEIAFLYGEQFILLQYIPAITRVVWLCDNSELQPTSSASLLSCCTLLLHLIPCLTDGTLLDLIEVRLVGEILLPLVAIISSPLYSFPSLLISSDGTTSRRILAFRVLDLIILLSQRIGYDHTRRFLRRTLKAFFKSFDIVHTDTGTWCRYDDVKSNVGAMDSNEFVDIKQSVMDTNEFYIGTPVNLNSVSPDSSVIGKSRSNVSSEVIGELEQVFTAELAHKAYVQCCRLAGGHYIEDLANDDLIRKLCSQHEMEIKERRARLSQGDGGADALFPGDPDGEAVLGDVSKTTNWFVPVPRSSLFSTEPVTSSPYDVVSGNKLTYNPPVVEKRDIQTEANFVADSDSTYHAIAAEKLKRSEMDAQTVRHLKGDWIAYWEHELGYGRDKPRPFDFKQIGLQVFAGHVGAVRSLHTLENENSFVSAGRDKTVRLWSLRNTGSGSSRCSPQFTYDAHKRPVFFAAYSEVVKQIVSCDGSIHVWDPVTSTQISQYEPSKTSGGVTAVQMMTNPLSSHYIVAATVESTIRFIDLRSDKLAHEFQVTNISNTGFIPGIAVGPTWIAIAHSGGTISTLDSRTGFHLASWMCKGIEGDLNQIVTYNNKEILTSTSDGQFSLWRYDSSTPVCQTKLANEQQIHTIKLYDKTIVTASPVNRVSTHQPNIYEGKFHSEMGDKLRPDIFKGNLSSMALLPLNRQLLLGSDSGTVHLVA